MPSNNRNRNSIYQLVLSGICVALLIVSAQVRIPIPFYPVPLSMQTFAVLLIALVLPAKQSFQTVFIYLILGLIGLPIFSSGGGFSYVFQPGFGYLLGFLPAAPATSLLQKKIKGRFAPLVASIVSSAIITITGISYYLLLQHFYLGEAVTINTAWAMFIVYLPLDIVKLISAALLAPKVQKQVLRAQSQ